MVLRYLVKQPKTLKSLSMNNLAGWVTSQAEKLTSTSLKQQQGDPTEHEEILSGQIELIRNHLAHNIPKTFHNKLATKVIRRLTELFQKRNSYKAIGRLIEMLFTTNLSSLSLVGRHCEIFFDSLFSKPFWLTGLTHLELKFPFEGSVPSEAYIIRLLKELHKLEYLDLGIACTDNILRCVAENCKLIETLKTSNNNVDDRSIDILTLLRNLRHVSFYSEKITKNGIARLLTACENIEHIVTIYADITHILENIVSSDGSAGKQFKLKSYIKRYDIRLEQMQVLAAMCPLIQEMDLIINVGRLYPNHLKGLKDFNNLRELTLSGYNFYEGHVQDVLETIGCNLVNLHLKFVRQIDLNALKYLCLKCPQLQSLTMLKCEAEKENLVPDLFFCEKEIPPLRFLKKLSLIDKQTLFTKFTNEQLIFLVTNCPNVEVLDICGVGVKVRPTETVLLHILDNDPKKLMHLKELRVSDNLSTMVIDKIVENCASFPQVIYNGY